MHDHVSMGRVDNKVDTQTTYVWYLLSCQHDSSTHGCAFKDCPRVLSQFVADVLLHFCVDLHRTWKFQKVRESRRISVIFKLCVCRRSTHKCKRMSTT